MNPPSDTSMQLEAVVTELSLAIGQLLRRVREVALEGDGAKLVGHWSILLRRLSRRSRRPCQKAAISTVQSRKGARAAGRAL